MNMQAAILDRFFRCVLSVIHLLLSRVYRFTIVCWLVFKRQAKYCSVARVNATVYCTSGAVDAYVNIWRKCDVIFPYNYLFALLFLARVSVMCWYTSDAELHVDCQ
jgi:hypothetical protein